MPAVITKPTSELCPFPFLEVSGNVEDRLCVSVCSSFVMLVSTLNIDQVTVGPAKKKLSYQTNGFVLLILESQI